MDRKQQQRETIRAECLKRGIKVEPRGIAFALSGFGVDLIVADLAMLDAEALKPYQPRK